MRYRIELEWASGFTALYEHSEGAPGFFHEEWIEGTEHAITVRDQEVHVVSPGRRPRRVEVPGGPAPEQALLDAMLEAIAGRVSELGVTDNLATIAVVEAAVLSSTRGEPVAPAEIAAQVGAEITV